MDEGLLQWLGILSRLDGRVSSLVVSYLATLEKIGQVGEIRWHDPELDRLSNKMRMKELGGAVFGLKQYLAESTVQSLSNILEGTWSDLRTDFGVRFNVWKPSVEPVYLKEARIVRALANVIKHTQGVTQRTSSKNRFLVRECGFPEDVPVWFLFEGQEPHLELVELIYRVYVFSLDLAAPATGYRHPVLELGDEERRTAVFEFLIPEVLGLRDS